MNEWIFFFFKSSFINFKYSACIFQKAVAASKEWKSKQVKRRKPEESDDAEVQAAYGAHLACQEFINFLPNFYGWTHKSDYTNKRNKISSLCLKSCHFRIKVYSKLTNS